MFSPVSNLFDTRPAEIHSFFPGAFHELKEEFLEYFHSIKGKDSHKLSKNYQEFNIDQHPIVSLWKRDREPVGFATVWARPFYPEKTVRILNRFYHDPIFSRTFFTRELGRPSTIHCFRQQYLLTRQLGYKYAFISRDTKSDRFFPKFIDTLSRYSETKFDFRSGPYRVAPGTTQSCYQAIGATALDNDSIESFFNFWDLK